MIGLLVFKEKLKQFYGKYNIYIVPVVKFLVGFLTFWLINANVGFMTKLKNPLIPVVMGLIASFIPYGVTAFLAGIPPGGRISSAPDSAAVFPADPVCGPARRRPFRKSGLDRSGVLWCLHLLYPDVFKAECGDTDRKLHDGDGGPFYPDRKKCVRK